MVIWYQNTGGNANNRDARANFSSGVVCTVAVGQYMKSTTKVRYFIIKCKICIKSCKYASLRL